MARRSRLWISSTRSRRTKESSLLSRHNSWWLPPPSTAAGVVCLLERQLEPRTVKLHVSAFRFFFVKTLKRPYLLDDIPYPKVPRWLPTILTVEEVTRLIDAARTLTDRTMLMVLYSTDMRNAEMRNLQIKDIDSRWMLIHIQRGKGGRDRYVPLSTTLLETLRAYWRWMKPKTWLCPGTIAGWRADEPTTPKVVWDACQSAAHRVPSANLILLWQFVWPRAGVDEGVFEAREPGVIPTIRLLVRHDDSPGVTVKAVPELREGERHALKVQAEVGNDPTGILDTLHCPRPCKHANEWFDQIRRNRFLKGDVRRCAILSLNEMLHFVELQSGRLQHVAASPPRNRLPAYRGRPCGPRITLNDSYRPTATDRPRQSMRVGYLPSRRDRLTCEPFISADDLSRLASDAPATDDHDKVQPTVRDALIGAAIGLLLIYAGTRISYWILRWLFIGVGLLSAFVISVFWTKVSPRAHLIMSRARGNVRRDRQLGTLIRNVKAEAWEADFRVRDRTVEILIDGEDEPNPALVARARELVVDFDTFERRLNDYLAQTAKEWASEARELGADISALRLRSIKLRSRKQVLVDFDGPDVDVYWSCESADGKFSGLDFDS
jgi:Phage integrase family